MEINSSHESNIDEFCVSRRPLRQVASRDSVVCKVCVFSERGWIEETCNGARVLLQGAPVIRRTRLTNRLTCGLTGGLDEGLTDSLAG